MRNAPPKIGILGSGSGSNFAAIARAIAESRLIAEIVLVISDNPDAGILQKARAL
ncbi:MAG: phosphoribosylglycinamide formyltransferase, partial [Verrucomicrobia bacterium]|nr:phosphoribosylglycinamide formyltransferase [Verrucomicrobiota bacterium]